ncbi:MAG TPA: YdiU family protein [Polyangiaceae bacterium]|nr:YdiU family protein [Polyangiaceae bacterium]
METPAKADSGDRLEQSAPVRRAPPLGLEHSFAERLEGLFVAWEPRGFAEPSLIEVNRALYTELGLPDLSDDDVARVFSGSLLPADARPVAQAYAGHQFGGYSPQLGDGRALLLGEVVDVHGRRRDIHLKGSGPTPFSRGGDGKATVGPVLREYLMGEAMHHLGIPTTRVLAAVATGEVVYRDRPLPGAVLARVAASHLRVGTLQFAAGPNGRGNLEKLVSYALERHYPDRAGGDAPARELLHAVAAAQGRLIARWMLVGFIHGVMNTDNMTLSGETIDYGPCAFMEAYDPATVFSSIDHQGRYAFGNQPSIGQWNLLRMGEALLPLLAPTRDQAIEHVRAALGLYLETFEETLLDGFRKKLGLVGEAPEDAALVSGWLEWMQQSKQDFTLAFRRLARGLLDEVPAFDDEVFRAWYTRYQARLGGEPFAGAASRMNAVNPAYIPRNHLVEEALAAAVDDRDLGPFRSLLEVFRDPFSSQPGRDRYAEPAPASFGPYVTFCGT